MLALFFVSSTLADITSARRAALGRVVAMTRVDPSVVRRRCATRVSLQARTSRETLARRAVSPAHRASLTSVSPSRFVPVRPLGTAPTRSARSELAARAERVARLQSSDVEIDEADRPERPTTARVSAAPTRDGDPRVASAWRARNTSPSDRMPRKRERERERRRGRARRLRRPRDLARGSRRGLRDGQNAASKPAKAKPATSASDARRALSACSSAKPRRRRRRRGAEPRRQAGQSPSRSVRARAQVAEEPRRARASATRACTIDCSARVAANARAPPASARRRLPPRLRRARRRSSTTPPPRTRSAAAECPPGGASVEAHGCQDRVHATADDGGGCARRRTASADPATSGAERDGGSEPPGGAGLRVSIGKSVRDRAGTRGDAARSVDGDERARDASWRFPDVGRRRGAAASARGAPARRGGRRCATSATSGGEGGGGSRARAMRPPDVARRARAPAKRAPRRARTAPRARRASRTCAVGREQSERVVRVQAWRRLLARARARAPPSLGRQGAVAPESPSAPRRSISPTTWTRTRSMASLPTDNATVPRAQRGPLRQPRRPRANAHAQRRRPRWNSPARAPRASRRTPPSTSRSKPCRTRAARLEVGRRARQGGREQSAPPERGRERGGETRERRGETRETRRSSRRTRSRALGRRCHRSRLAADGADGEERRARTSASSRPVTHSTRRSCTMTEALPRRARRRGHVGVAVPIERRR